MKRETYDSEIKVRVPSWMKKFLEMQANANDLELSDIVRQALKGYATGKANTRAMQPV